MARGAYPVAAGHGAPLAPGVALDEVEHAARRVAGAEFRGALPAEQFYRLLGDLREPGRDGRGFRVQALFETAVAQGEPENGEFRRGRVHPVERLREICHRRGRGCPAVFRAESGEPPDGIAQRACLHQFGLRRLRPRALGADGIEPLVHVRARAKVIVDAVLASPDRAHQAHGGRLVRQCPGALRGRGGRHGWRLSRVKALVSVRRA
jgi:hypothetical protein